MKQIKRVLLLILTFLVLASVFSINITAATVSTKKATMLQYTYLNLTFKKPEKEKYKCSVTNNKDKYISVDAYNDGEYYWLTVRSKKATKKDQKPTITIYKEKDGKKTTIKKFQITVTPVHKVEMQNIKINKGTGRQIKLINPYYDAMDYNLEYDKNKIRITQVLYAGDKCYYTLEGLKNGKTTVKAYLRGTKTLIGSFTVTVGDFQASVKESKKKITIYYNSHMSDSRKLNGGSFVLGEVISNYHANSVYTVEAENAKLIATQTVGKDKTTPKSALVYSKGTGTTKLTVYEKRGNDKKKKIGTISLTVKKAKDSEVYASNRERDNDGIFYENFICPGDKYNLKKAVTSLYINNSYSHFEESEYTFTAISLYSNTIMVNKNGICACYGLGKNRVIYTVKFKDGSKASGIGSFNILSREELYGHDM